MRSLHGRYWIGAAVGLTVVVHLGGRVPVAQGQAPTQVSVGAIAVGEGLTGAVDVTVKGVTGLYAVDVRLKFDPSAVQVVDADPATEGVQLQIGDFLDRGLAVRNTADNTTGEAWFAVTQLNPSEPKNGQGRLFSILLRGGKAGARSAVTIVAADLASRSGEKIPATLVNGEVRVVSQNQAPPTPTTAPIARPTLVLPSPAADRPTSRSPVVATPAVGAATTNALLATNAAPTVSGSISTSAAAGATQGTGSGVVTAAPVLPGQTEGVAQGTSGPAETTIATWTVPPADAAVPTPPGPVVPGGDGKGTNWLWLLGPIVLIALLYVVVRTRGSR
jgi:hypothetical protein